MREVSVVFGDDRGLVGTVCHASPSPDAAGLGVLLFNAGVVHRVGPHRVQVKLARVLAACGVPSLRFDLHGMGDSARAGTGLAHREQVVQDLRCAMDCLQGDTGASRFAVFGFCSGAPHSVHVAQADPRVVRIVLYDGFEAHTPKSRWRFLLLRLRARGLGPKVLARVAPRALARLRGHLQALGHRHAQAQQEVTRLSDLVPTLRELAQRGVDVVVLNAGADFSQFNYEEQAQDALAAAGLPRGMVRSGYLDNADHVVTTIPMQRAFIEWSCANLLGPPGASASPR